MSSSTPPQRVGAAKNLYRFRTRAGVFYIAPCRKGWDVQHAGETLGTRYPSAQAALDELVGGRTRLTRDGADPSSLGLARSIEEWERLGSLPSREHVG